MAVRLGIKEAAERYHINRYELGRRAKLSNPTMDKFWLHPELIAVRLDTLDRIAQALTALIHEQDQESNVEVTVLDLIKMVK